MSENLQSWNSIPITIFTLDGRSEKFIIPKKQKLSKFKSEYKRKNEKKCKYYIFYYHGKMIRDSATPEELGMEDGDKIYVDGATEAYMREKIWPFFPEI